MKVVLRRRQIDAIVKKVIDTNYVIEDLEEFWSPIAYTEKLD